MSRTNKIDSKIPYIFNKIRKGSTFMSIRGYTNNYGEVSDFGIVFHFSYLNAVNKSINIWKGIKPVSTQERYERDRLIESYTETAKYGFNHRARSAHAYTKVYDFDGNVIEGVKLHIRKRELHLVGLRVHKKIIKPGFYPLEDKTQGQMIRESMMQMTPLANYRQFKLINGRFDSISVDSLTLDQGDLVRKMLR